MKILVLGSTGFVGKHVMKKIKELHPDAEVACASLSLDTDLRDMPATVGLFKSVKPEYVINCSAYVGGIQYGYIHPAEIFHNNMLMIVNVFEVCRRFGVRRLIHPISNCAYPADEMFFKEENFWNGPLHDSVMVYGMTRKMMTTGAWAYSKQYGFDTVNLIVSNMYGPGDHFDEVRSHALGALVKKIVDAKRQGREKVVIWGTGEPVREWLYVEDGAEALVRAMGMESYIGIVNVGSGNGISIRDLANTIKEVVGWEGNFEFDTTKPDGAPYKTVDGSLGKKMLKWGPSMSLRDGIEKTVRYYSDI